MQSNKLEDQVRKNVRNSGFAPIVHDGSLGAPGPSASTAVTRNSLLLTRYVPDTVDFFQDLPVLPKLQK